MDEGTLPSGSLHTVRGDGEVTGGLGRCEQRSDCVRPATEVYALDPEGHRYTVPDPQDANNERFRHQLAAMHHIHIPLAD